MGHVDRLEIFKEMKWKRTITLSPNSTIQVDLDSVWKLSGDWFLP